MPRVVGWLKEVNSFIIQWDRHLVNALAGIQVMLRLLYYFEAPRNAVATLTTSELFSLLVDVLQDFLMIIAISPNQAEKFTGLNSDLS